MRCRGLLGLANPAYLSWFPSSVLHCVALYCVPGGVRVVSGVRRSRGAGSIESRWRAGPRKGSQLSRPPEHGNLESWRIPPSLSNNPPLSRSGSSRHRAQSNLRKLRSVGMGRALHAGFDNVNYLLERVGLAEKEGLIGGEGGGVRGAGDHGRVYGG